MRALLLHNPSAGAGKPSAAELVELLEEAGYSVRYCSTKERGALADCLKERAELVVVAGGDGTVGKVLTRLPDRHAPVAILPLGTANNIARSLGIEGKPKSLVAGWKKAHPRRFRVGAINGPWGQRRFVEAIGLGLLAQAIDEADGIDLPKPERLIRGRRAFAKALAKSKVKPLEITVDGEPLPQDLLLVEVMNICYAGPGLHLAPAAGAENGLLDIVYLQAEQRQAMLEWLETSHPQVPPPVQLRKGHRIAFAWCGRALRIDDEILAAPEQPAIVTIELEPDQVQVLVPPPEKEKDPEKERGKEAKKNKRSTKA